MTNEEMTTLSQAINILTKEGFKEDFKAESDCIKALYSKKNYSPNELKIVKTLRFEGMTNPADAAVLYAIIAKDGTKGTMVMSYAAKQEQNPELVKQIRFERK